MSRRTDAERVAGRQARVALIGLVVMGLLLLGAINFQRLSSAGDRTIYAEFADASGLKVGEDVRVAGVKVGRITGIELRSGHVRAELTVDSDATGRLGGQTHASIEVKSLLGQHYVALESRGAGSLDDDDVIPLARTDVPLDLVPAFQTLTEDVGEIDTAQVGEALDTLSATLDRASPEVRATLDGLSAASRSISTRDRAIRSLLAHARQVTDVVSMRDEEIAEILRSTALVMDTLDQQQAVITRLIDGTLELSAQIRGLVAENEDVAPKVLADLDSVLTVLQRNRASIAETVELAELYAREFVSVGGTGPWFDATVTLPGELAICAQETGPLSDLVGQIIRALPWLSGSPCLPLGLPGGGR